MITATKITTIISCAIIMAALGCQATYAEDSANYPNAPQEQGQPAPNSAPTAMDEKVQAAIHTAAEITQKTEKKVSPVIETIKAKYQNFADTVQQQFNDKIATPVGNTVESIKNKATQYNTYFRQEFGLPEAKPEAAAEVKNKNTQNPKSFLEQLVGEGAGNSDKQQTELLGNNPAAISMPEQMQTPSNSNDNFTTNNNTNTNTNNNYTNNNGGGNVYQPNMNKQSAPPQSPPMHRAPAAGGGNAQPPHGGPRR